jgi:hypothetical protein
LIGHRGLKSTFDSAKTIALFDMTRSALLLPDKVMSAAPVGRLAHP